MENKPRTIAKGALDRTAWVRRALDTIAEEGTAALRVEVLAKRLGVTKGSFYWHFKDRRDLLEAILQDWRDGRIRDIRKQTAAEAGGELGALHHTISVYSAGRNRRGIAIERAIRIWAGHDSAAAAVVAEVDTVRLECARRLFLARGLSTDEASARSILLYAYVFGVSLMHCQDFEQDLPKARRWIADLIAEKP